VSLCQRLKGQRLEQFVGVAAWILVGLAVAILARAVIPRSPSSGWLAYLALGVVGGLLGGFTASVVFGVGTDAFFEPSAWLLAAVGATLVVLVYSLITRGAQRP
jgi:uncharacterized membrane protein YeaQ/YmgE (transglycosylase-associated protein family)